jgi:hypothetical protein
VAQLHRPDALHQRFDEVGWRIAVEGRERHILDLDAERLGEEPSEVEPINAREAYKPGGECLVRKRLRVQG